MEEEKRLIRMQLAVFEINKRSQVQHKIWPKICNDGFDVVSLANVKMLNP